jgi:hypothetical protein
MRKERRILGEYGLEKRDDVLHREEEGVEV